MTLQMAYFAWGCEPVMREATCHQAGGAKEGANPAGVIIRLPAKIAAARFKI
jgi:hypothetical protein